MFLWTGPEKHFLGGKKIPEGGSVPKYLPPHSYAMSLEGQYYTVPIYVNNRCLTVVGSGSQWSMRLCDVFTSPTMTTWLKQTIYCVTTLEYPTVLHEWHHSCWQIAMSHRRAEPHGISFHTEVFADRLRFRKYSRKSLESNVQWWAPTLKNYLIIIIISQHS